MSIFGSAHSLVVGGSGMLRGVVLHLAASGHHVTVVARNRRRLEALARAPERAPGTIGPVALDYRELENLAQHIGEVQQRKGPIEIAVCWIHATAPDAPEVIAEALEVTGRSCRYFHVFGSATDHPALKASEAQKWTRRFPNLHYRQIILGFTYDGPYSRWLTNEEISNGVVSAIISDAARTIVGTVEPWELRPRLA